MKVKTESEMKVKGDVEEAVKMEGVEEKSEIKTEIKDEIRVCLQRRCSFGYPT